MMSVAIGLTYLQFLKFQAFAEQLSKEIQDLKVKIESHKRENRRLTLLIDQQKDDAARLTVQVSATEKQRDDALEALVLQQEIAEELERERKRNTKVIIELEQANSALIRSRDDSQRVVLHLRSLIDGQTHHMEHIVRSLNQTPGISSYITEGYDEVDDLDERGSVASSENMPVSKRLADLRNEHHLRSAVSYDGTSKTEGEHVTPEMENRFFNFVLSEKGGRASRLSMADVADRHLRDKTDAIAHIIRNISEQCAAAVEGLQLAHDADRDDDLHEGKKVHDENLAPSEDGHEQSVRTDYSEAGEESSFLTPDHRRYSSIPSTPDLVHNRSSTSMSIVSTSIASDRSSQRYESQDHGIVTKIAENGDEDETHSQISSGHIGNSKKGLRHIDGSQLSRPVTARVVQ